MQKTGICGEERLVPAILIKKEQPGEEEEKEKEKEKEEEEKEEKEEEVDEH